MTLILERPADTAEAARAFAFAPGICAALDTFRTRCTVVRLATLDNDLLGVARWCTLAEAWAEPGSAASRHWDEHPVVVVGPHDDPHLVLATRTPVVILGMDNEGVPWARTIIDSVRATCASVLTVDLAPGPRTPRYADVSTNGFDRARGTALLDLLTP